MALRFRFGLRTLLLATVAVAIACGFLSRYARQVDRQRVALAGIAELGGEVRLSDPFEEWIGAHPRGAGWARTTFPNWTCSVVAVTLRGERVGDLDIAKLTQLPKLQSLDLSGSQASDESVGILSRFPVLRKLDLTGTRVSADGIARLRAALPNAEIAGPAP